MNEPLFFSTAFYWQWAVNWGLWGAAVIISFLLLWTGPSKKVLWALPTALICVGWLMTLMFRLDWRYGAVISPFFVGLLLINLSLTQNPPPSNKNQAG